MHASSMPVQQPNIAQMTSLKEVSSQVQDDCFLCISIRKRPQLLPFYRRLGKLEGKKKKLMSLHQQEDAIQFNGSETVGFPLARNTR